MQLMTKTYRFKVNKLIRDKVPSIMISDAIRMCTRVMNKVEYIESLKDKLLEEANEVIVARDVDNLKEEIADLLEVMKAICLFYQVSWQEIEQVRNKKRKAKGGFSNAIYSDFVEMESSNQNVDYYLNQPNKYPQVKQSEQNSE